MCDSKNMLIGLSNGKLQLLSWNGEVYLESFVSSLNCDTSNSAAAFPASRAIHLRQ